MDVDIVVTLSSSQISSLQYAAVTSAPPCLASLVGCLCQAGVVIASATTTGAGVTVVVAAAVAVAVAIAVAGWAGVKEVGVVAVVVTAAGVIAAERWHRISREYDCRNRSRQNSR